MNSYSSKEIRWFVNAEKAMELEKWFRSHSISRAFPYDTTFSRNDYYLIMPGVRDTGIKIRDLQTDENGKWNTAFEVKKRISVNEQAKFAGNEGLVNSWVKLSYPVRENLQSFFTVIPENSKTDTNWLEVGKDRMLVKFDAVTGQFSGEESRPEEGCGVELTKLVVRSGLYFSFGLEAFSLSGQRLDQNFEDCANQVFQSGFISGLSPGQSNSYPEWINDVLLPG